MSPKWHHFVTVLALVGFLYILYTVGMTAAQALDHRLGQMEDSLRQLAFVIARINNE